MRERLANEENNMFFICPQGHVRYNFDEASDEEFLCVCGEELEFQDNSDIIKHINERIELIESDLNSFNETINK